MPVDIYAFSRCFGSDLQHIQGIHAFRNLAFLVPCFMGTQLHKPIFWDWVMLNDFTTTYLTTAKAAILRPIQKMVTGKISNI